MGEIPSCCAGFVSCSADVAIVCFLLQICSNTMDLNALFVAVLTLFIAMSDLIVAVVRFEQPFCLA